MSTIYKICPAEAWREAERAGAYRGSPDDQHDGFIHFSTAAQLGGTLAKHFAGQAGLVLVSAPVAAFGDVLRWEPSRGGDLFPHLYGDFDPKLAEVVTPLALDADGRHRLPEALS